MASIGYPLLIDLDRLQDKKFAALQRSIFALFNKFIIHTPPALENPYIQQSIASESLSGIYASFMKNIKKKIFYSGYVLPEKVLTGGDILPALKLTAPTVIISRGGGAVYPNLIALGIQAQAHLGKNIRIIMACGPATTPDEMKLFKSLLKKSDTTRIVLARYLDNLDDILKTCQASVSLCGYNTSVQLMHFGTPSVIVPYQNSHSLTSTNDQLARAQLL